MTENKNYINVLFLDFDGVINTQQFYKDKLHKDTILSKDNYYIDICSPSYNRVSNTQAVTLIDMLCHKFDLKIVVTSTWRIHGDQAETLYNSGLSRDIEVLGQTDRLGSRDKEILSYIDSCNTYNRFMHTGPYIKNFLVLDDDIGDMVLVKDHLIQTNVYDGFTFSKYLEACELIERWDNNGTSSK